MSENTVSIGQVKRDISELVNRVASGGERIVLTSRGKPKAALVSLEDYEILQQRQREVRLANWKSWQAKWRELMGEIMEDRGGEPLDAEALWQAVLDEREARFDNLLGR
jgi:prevent-host-death family protein